MKHEVIVVGGGLAGLVSSIHLSMKGIDVCLIEKDTYPRHKVCGEYVSNEILPYLDYLGFNPRDYGATQISRVLISSYQGRSVESQLPLGGFGLSRYTLDSKLAEMAVEKGVSVIHASVTGIEFKEDTFFVNIDNNTRKCTTEDVLRSGVVIGAFGKRSKLDKYLKRPFFLEKSPFLAVKGHYSGEFPNDLVGLHNFKGGYCGISKVEKDLINICYLTDYKSFKEFTDINQFQENVLYSNKFLREAFTNLNSEFENPLTIGQISFSSKSTVENHILMAGDSAGMIHPLAGNGMGMAIRSAFYLSTEILKFMNGNCTRTEMERNYANVWKQQFHSRLQSGHYISGLLKMNSLSEVLLMGLKLFPGILPYIIRQTHGETMKINTNVD